MSINLYISALHRSTTYVDAADCYRPSSVVCQSLSTADEVEKPFGFRTLVGTGNHVLGGSPDPHGKAQLWGIGAPIVKYKDFLPWAVQKNGWTDQFAVWVVDSIGRRMHKFNRIRQVAPTCPHGRTPCRHLANTIELSACDGDAPYVKLLWPLVIFGRAHLDSRTDSRALQVEYCTVGIPHNTAV